MRVALTIPAKGTSERVPGKNLYKIGGKSLVYRVCDKALDCKEVDYVYLDTECPKIVADVSGLLARGLRLISRPKALATNDCNANDLITWALHSIEDVDVICQTFPTSPLITSETIDRVIRKWKNSKGYDSFMTVVPVREYFWKNGKADNFSITSLPNSQDLEPLMMESHGLYGVTVDSFLEGGTRVGKNPLLVEVSKTEGLDIDDQEDMQLAEAIIIRNESR